MIQTANGKLYGQFLGHKHIRIQTPVKIFEFALKFLEIPAFLPFSISFPQLSPSG
jgi:hypothetical protein